MNKLCSNIVDLCAFDYENIESIRSNLTDVVGYNPNDQEIHEALNKLISLGQITLYKYNQAKQKYESVSGKEYSNELWFMS